MIQKENCKIGVRVYYENSTTGMSRTGIINSEPDGDGTIDLVDIGSIVPPKNNDRYKANWQITTIEDVMKDKDVMRKINKEAKDYDMTVEEYMRKIKMI